MDLSVFQRDIADLSAALKQALEIQLFGSYSERNPGLGKMMTCPFCRTRRRQFATEKCCNASHATTRRAWTEEEGFHQEPCEPRVNEALMPKWFFKRFRHKRHSNLLRHQIHDMALLLQDETARDTTQMILEGLPGFHEPQKPIPPQAVPAFAERVVRSIRKHKSNQKRKQQQTARRINFSLINGQNG